VLEALGLVVTGDRETPVNCLVSDFTLRNGVATARTTALDTPDTLVVGSGNFNFAAETIYVDLTPYDKTPTVLTLHVPVHVRGTFADPQLGISKAAIARKLAESAVLGVLLPPIGELLPFVDLGLGHDNACRKAFSVVDATRRAAAQGAAVR
jgi:uncharacterized protein involved in outer membrane biogenesis